MFMRWLPWRLVLSRLARSRGFIDPVKLLARFESFAQPLEVKEPLELLRAGLTFHARGLLNTATIQHNLDWVWPYWVERQYDPRDPAFIPRAFSITHVNLTHRNWSAVGLPDCCELPIVDPRGLLTPFWDGWSLDGWVVRRDRSCLHPSQLAAVEQRFLPRQGAAVETESRAGDLRLLARAAVEEHDGVPCCRLELTAEGDDAWLAVALRPFNPEGVSFIAEIAPRQDGPGFTVRDRDALRSVELDREPACLRFSDYRRGDVHTHLFDPAADVPARCGVGMATAAALFPSPGQVRVRVPLVKAGAARRRPRRASWGEVWGQAGAARLPDSHWQSLWEAALASLVLHSPAGEVYPGPYTYRRFWFRDATFILHALAAVGLEERVERTLDRFPSLQKRSGFFHSQEGEWDSNGEVLWLLWRFCRLTGRVPSPDWQKMIERGAAWIVGKRLSEETADPHAGLLPPGFSAEHLGPNDYYYWDDFWGAAGLHAAAELLAALGERREAERYREEAERFAAAIDRSLEATAARLGRPAMPASPYRRLDSGAIGSLAAGYPTQLLAADDARLLDTAGYLMDECLLDGGFFLDIIHSGVNPYLTLHIAQVLMRAGDRRAARLLAAVAERASPTGHWPEAVHPRTGGGCMGDGHHAWAAAEWVLAVRNAFMREEGRRLVLGAGLPEAWLEGDEPFSFGPAPTCFGPVRVAVRPAAEGVTVEWSGRWRKAPPVVEVQLPGERPVRAPHDAARLTVERAVAVP